MFWTKKDEIMKKIKALIWIIRPELPVAAGICVVVGQVIAHGKFPPIATIALGFALGFFLSSSAMVFNDIFDLEVDRLNAPQRPLPSGMLTKPEAIVWGVCLGMVGLILAVFISPMAFVLSLVLWTLGFLFNWRLKSAGLWGNLIVSLNVAMTIIIGGVSVGGAASPMVWIFGAIAFFFDLAEEIAGDAMDIVGDLERGSKSIAIVHGKQPALKVSAILLGVVIALTIVPILLGETSPRYWVPIALMDLVIVVFTCRLFQSKTPQEGRQAMRVMYLSATLGLAAFIVGRF